jgi:hypothetical protein
MAVSGRTILIVALGWWLGCERTASPGPCACAVVGDRLETTLPCMCERLGGCKDLHAAEADLGDREGRFPDQLCYEIRDYFAEGLRVIAERGGLDPFSLWVFDRGSAQLVGLSLTSDTGASCPFDGGPAVRPSGGLVAGRLPGAPGASACYRQCRGTADGSCSGNDRW